MLSADGYLLAVSSRLLNGTRRSLIGCHIWYPFWEATGLLAGAFLGINLTLLCLLLEVNGAIPVRG